MTSSLDPVTYALMDVRDRIPPIVLSLVFNKAIRGHVQSHVALPDAALYAVRQAVIEGRIRRVVDASGAVEAVVPLLGLVPEQVDRFTKIWRIPKSLTNGRTITSAYALTFTSTNLLGTGFMGGSNLFDHTSGSNSQMSAAANRLMDANSNASVNQSANCTILGDNVVMVQDFTPIAMNGHLRCIVGSDSEFSHIKPQYHQPFANLVLMATKAYIYNNYMVELGQGFLSGGQELPQVREIIERYADADELFMEMLPRFKKISMLNDGPRSKRFNRRMLGSSI